MLVKKLMALGGYTRAEDLERDYPTMESFVEAFPQAQVLINQYKKQAGGGQQDPLTQVIIAVAEQMGVDAQQLANMLQKSPDLIQQLSQLAAQDPNKAAQALVQVLQSSSGQQGQAPAQAELAQPGQMPMNPEEAMMAAYGGSKLSRFIRKTGGDIAFPQAAPMYDNSIYRRPIPNIPRLFAEGGENDPSAILIEQIRRAREAANSSEEGPVNVSAIPTEAYAKSQGLQEVSNKQYENTVSSLKKNKSIDSTEGMTVSQIWTKVTGLPWSEAKKRGLTDGSYSANVALKKDLLKGVKVNKQASKEEPGVSRKQKPAGRSAMVNKINEDYENRQGQRYIQANAPNRYTAPTQAAMDLYEAGLNYIDRNAAGVPMNYGYSAPTSSAVDLYEAGQNYIERNAAGAPRNRYVAPTPEAMDLYESGLNYLERNSAPSNRAIVNTPRNLPFSYFSNPNTARFLGKPQSGRVYQYGGNLPSFQGDEGPSETGTVLRQDPSTGYPVANLPEFEVSAQAYRPPMLMPPQRQQAGFFPELGAPGFYGTLVGAGLVGAGGRYAYNNLKLNVNEDALNKAASKKVLTSDKAYSEISSKVQKMELDRYNKLNKTKFPTLYEKGIPKEVQQRHSSNTAILYNLKKENPKQYREAYKLLAMYPDLDLKEAAQTYSERSGLGKIKGRFASKYRRQGTAGKVGMGLLGIIGTLGAAEGLRYLYNKYISSPDELTEEEKEILQSVESSDSYAPATNSSIDYGALQKAIEADPTSAYDQGLSTTIPNNNGTSTYNADSTVIVSDNKYGGVAPYAYGGTGGGNPYGYGYFPPIMAEGGDIAMPGIDKVDSEVDRRRNTLFNFVKNNVTRSQMPESFRKGGAKKKKG